eukprot:jgi/Picsp_1/5622/NSC_02981-R1_---NA---
MLWKKGSSGRDQEHKKEQPCCGRDGGNAQGTTTKKEKKSDASCRGGKTVDNRDEGENHGDGGGPEVSVFEFMSDSPRMTGHCQTGTDGIQACLWTPGAKGQAGHKIVF